MVPVFDISFQTGICRDEINRQLSQAIILYGTVRNVTEDGLRLCSKKSISTREVREIYYFALSRFKS